MFLREDCRRLRYLQVNRRRRRCVSAFHSRSSRPTCRRKTRRETTRSRSPAGCEPSRQLGCGSRSTSTFVGCDECQAAALGGERGEACSVSGKQVARVLGRWQVSLKQVSMLVAVLEIKPDGCNGQHGKQRSSDPRPALIMLAPSDSLRRCPRLGSTFQRPV